jgi:hippurate hydrolase
MLKEKIHQLADKHLEEFIQLRRHLHANPELSYQEYETAAFVETKLQELGLQTKRLADTGVVALIEGKNPDTRTVALRADMDALPIQEANNVPYRSKKDGIMHACGHDVHTTCLLGAAKILTELRNEWTGTVKLIFQPGEEKNPGGASYMIRDGVLKNPSPQSIFALHVHPGLATGQVSFRSGKVMASADELYFTIKGKGGHAAAPHLVIDPILIASHLIISLQQIISRNRNPHHPSVLSITAFQAGTTTNVIPDEVKLMGTFRAMDEDWRAEGHRLLHKYTKEITESMGGSAELHIDKGYPCVFNDETLHTKAVQLAENFLGKEHVEETELRMGAEDFGYYSQEIPGCFFRLGVMNKEKGITSGVHTPTFNIDEAAIKTGMGLLAWMGANAS